MGKLMETPINKNYLKRRPKYNFDNLKKKPNNQKIIDKHNNFFTKCMRKII